MSEYRGAEVTRRVGFVLFAIVGVFLILNSLFWEALGPATSWSVAGAGVLCAAALHLCRFSIGTVPHRSAVLGLSVVALPALSAIIAPWAAVGIIALGVALTALARSRRAAVALYSAGLAGTGGITAVAAFVGLSQVIDFEALAWALACVAHIALTLVVEVLRLRFTKARRNLRDVWALSSTRLAALSATCMALAFVAAALGTQGITDNSRRLNAIVVLLGLTLAAVGTKFVMRNLVMRRRLIGLIAGASDISASGRKSAVSSRAVLSPAAAAAKDGAEITAMLCSAVADAIGGESVSLRRYPARRGEISATVTLREDTVRYIVARRDPMDLHFTGDDRITLQALAHAANVVIKARANIGGLTARANTDPLTGLPNYGAFHAALANINDNRGYSEAIAVLFIDLDDFKRLNDRYGHHVGDDMLAELGRRLISQSRPHDVVARVGGDEFVVILTHLSSLAEAKKVADRIMTVASQPLTLGSNTFKPVISIGLAYSAHRETDINSLVKDADRSMLAIKKSRRKGGPAKESSINISGHRSSQINDIVARAIDEDRLELAFQPIVSLLTGQIWAFEALVRYTDPDLGPLSPSSLVEKAKGLGRLDLLTKQVAQKAMDAAVEFRLVDRAIVCMTINVEAGQVLPDRVGSFVADLAQQHPEISLCLELNERSVGRVSTEVRAQAEKLRDMGLMIALDDYGSQDSSVDSLVRVPMDILKIDRSLVDDLADVRQREVLMALQGFGDSLEYSMIVEGVESEEMATHLHAIGVRNAQGFYYGIPMNLEATVARLEEFGSTAVLETRSAYPASAGAV